MVMDQEDKAAWCKGTPRFRVLQCVPFFFTLLSACCSCEPDIGTASSTAVQCESHFGWEQPSSTLGFYHWTMITHFSYLWLCANLMFSHHNWRSNVLKHESWMNIMAFIIILDRYIVEKPLASWVFSILKKSGIFFKRICHVSFL